MDYFEYAYNQATQEPDAPYTGTLEQYKTDVKEKRNQVIHLSSYLDTLRGKTLSQPEIIELGQTYLDVVGSFSRNQLHSIMLHIGNHYCVTFDTKVSPATQGFWNDLL